MTDHSEVDFATADGTEHNTLFGKEASQQELKHKKTFRKLPPKKLKQNISVENKESSKHLNSNITRSKRSFAEDQHLNLRADVQYFQKKYTTAMKDAALWELGIDDQYCEDDVMSIMGMLSYLENIERGFGHLNDEALFKSERQSDSNGELFKEAMRGFALSKEYITLRRSLMDCKRARIV